MLFGRRGKRGNASSANGTDAYSNPKEDGSNGSPEEAGEKDRLPHANGNKHQKHSWINEEGDAGRNGFHPWHFVHCCFKSTSKLSMAVNVLWPFVPAALAVGFIYNPHHDGGAHAPLVFGLNYVAMIPAANLIGYAGQELARKLPHVLGVLAETTLSSIVEIVLFSVLVSRNLIFTVRAAIVGSILANLLLCLGLCFIAGGFQRHDQVFHEVVSEVGSGLLLVAGFGLILPTAFASSATADLTDHLGVLISGVNESRLLSISRATGIVLLLSYVGYVGFNMSSHHGLVSEVFENDEKNDEDRPKDLAKKKLTFTECIIALVISITCVSIIAVHLVLNIEPIVERGVSDQFMGLILVPLVEKVAEHLTAIDEAYDNMPNLALAHVLGATVQTALLNAPIVVFVGWGLGVPMDLNFKQFEAIVLILAIIVMGNFLRDGKSNWLEGMLAVFIYVIIAVCAWYYPNPPPAESGQGEGGHAARLMMRAVGG